MLKKIIVNIIFIVFLLSMVLASWRIGYYMGGKDELKRIKRMINIPVEQEKKKTMLVRV